MSDEIKEALDALEVCEGALIDYFAAEDGLDIETARAVARMASDALIAAGRVSQMVEMAKRAST
jgi:hypothetical protein